MDVIEQQTGPDPDAGPVTPARLREAQRAVAAHARNLAVRNALVQRASAAGWSDEEIREALSSPESTVSIYQVARVRKGMTSGKDTGPRRTGVGDTEVGE